MEAAMVESVAQKLEKDTRVEQATPKNGSQGPFVEVEAIDTLARNDLDNELHQYPVFIDLT